MRTWGALALLAATAMAQDIAIEKEIGLGRLIAAEFGRGVRPIESASVLAYVDGIGQRLAKLTGGPPFPYTFSVVVDSSTALHESAAFPGGFVVVPSSLILTVQDEDELAGMLAHSIAHIASRHGIRRGPPGVIPLIFMGGWAGYAAKEGQPAIPMSMLPIARKNEIDADRLAARTMSEAGYDPAALSRYIERVQPPDDPQPKAWWPLPQRSERLDAIRVAIGELPARSYGRHEGLDRVQEEVRRLTAAP